MEHVHCEKRSGIAYVPLRVAILAGAGKAFCAGADLKTFIPQWEGATILDVRRNIATGIGGGLTRGQHRLGKPVIAAFNAESAGTSSQTAQ